MRSEYQGIKFYGENDLLVASNLDKAISILEALDENRSITDVNEVIELYNIDLLINCGVSLHKWEDSTQNYYKTLCKLCMKIIEQFFAVINDDNFLEICNAVDIGYTKDFWKLVAQFRVYKRFSGKIFEKYLNEPETTLWIILKEKKIVKHYGKELAECLRNSDQTANLIIDKFFKKHDFNTSCFFPKELSPTEYEGILQKYVKSEPVNVNDLQILAKAQSTKECPISDRLRLSAKEAYESYWDKNAFNGVQIEYGIGVEFKESSELISQRRKGNEGNNWLISYDIQWFRKNTEYPTILNNFLYIFNYFDMHWRSNLVSIKSEIGILERCLATRGVKDYITGHIFDAKQNLSIMQMKGYYDILKKLEIRLEDVFQWFFEKYLAEEFGAEGFRFNPPSEGTNYIEKCRTIASEMESVLKQFRMYVQDGTINQELFEMSSGQIVFSQLDGFIKEKYAYSSSQQIQKEQFLLFSDQSLLNYTEKTGSNYKTFYELLLNESMRLSDFHEFQIKEIKWLVDRGTVILQYDVLRLNIYRIKVLKDLYDHDVICVQYYERLAEWVDIKELKITGTLFSEPEQKYMNYMLNKAEFSNGLDLRNKYVHGTYPSDERMQCNDYMNLLKIMVLVVGKINEEFCLNDNKK